MKRTILFFLLVFGFAAFLTSCSKEFSYENGGAVVGDAVGSLKDTAGECLPDTVHGTFYNGVTPGSDTANVAIQVRVDSAGSYKIYTDLQNGFMFADSGYFNSTGIQTVYLKPIGTPILPIATDFTVTFDTSVCGFTVYVQDSTGTGLGGGGGNNQHTDSTNFSDTAWKFTNDTVNYHGHVDTAFIYDTTVASITYKYFTIIGSTSSYDTSVEIGIYLPAGIIQPGTYNTNEGSGFYFVENTSGNFIYTADYSTQTFNVTYTITSVTDLDATHKIVTGTYSGTVKDAAGNTFTITTGSFKVNVTTG